MLYARKDVAIGHLTEGKIKSVPDQELDTKLRSAPAALSTMKLAFAPYVVKIRTT